MVDIPSAESDKPCNTRLSSVVYDRLAPAVHMAMTERFNAIYCSGAPIFSVITWGVSTIERVCSVVESVMANTGEVGRVDEVGTAGAAGGAGSALVSNLGFFLSTCTAGFSSLKPLPSLKPPLGSAAPG